MQYGIDVSTAGSYANPRTLADLAVEAEEAGWDGFFVWDVVFLAGSVVSPISDPWVALAAIAMATRHIRIGVMVAALPRRQPWDVARETVSLDHLSQGRLIVGVGLGFQAQDFTAFGGDVAPITRAEKLDESLAVVTGLWTGEPFSFSGKHYRINDVTFLPTPLQLPRIPLWIAGYWPNRRPLQRAARWDGVVPGKVDDEDLNPGELREMMTYIQAHRQKTGPFDVAVYGRTPLSPNDAAGIVQPWVDAGATWWREGIEDERGSLEAMRKRIRSGPPRVS